MSVIGIDFGNEAVVIAVARHKGIDVILNESSKRFTPVLVSFQDTERKFGVNAESIQRSNLARTVNSLKFYLGRQYDEPEVQARLANEKVSHERLPNGLVGFSVFYNDKDCVFSATELMAMFFGNLKDIVETATGSTMSGCVISAPLYYTDTQRQALIDSAAIANVKVHRVMNEHLALGLAYGYPRSVRKQFDAEKETKVMFVDFGALDFQCTIAAFKPKEMVIKGTGYDSTLGGRNIDEAIATYLASEFKKSTSVDCSKSAKAMLKLRDVGLKAKKTLSPNGVPLARVAAECLYQDRDLQCKLEYETFATITAHLVPRMKAAIERCLVDAKMTPEDINAVEMVGGSMRVRWAKTVLSEVMKRPTEELFIHLGTSDDAVARGCALQCAILSPATKMHPFDMVDAVSFPVDYEFGDEVKESVTLYSKNHATPFKKRITFPAKSASNGITVAFKYSEGANILEGSPAALVSYAIQKPTTEGDIRVTVDHDMNGIVSLIKAESMVSVEVEVPLAEGEEPTEGEEKKFKTKTTAVPVEVKVLNSLQMTAEAIKEAAASENVMTHQDKEAIARVDKLNELESYCYDTRDKLVTSLQDYIAKDDLDTLNAKLDEYVDWLYGDEGFESGTLAQITERLSILRAIADPAAMREQNAKELPSATSEYFSAIEEFRTILNKGGSNEAYTHLSDEDWDSIRSSVKTSESWLNTNLDQQRALPLTAAPVVTVIQVRDHVLAFKKSVYAILNKPKPKPKPVEVPKEEPKETDDEIKVEETDASNVDVEMD